MKKVVLSAFADEIDMDLTTQMDVLDTHGIKHIEMRGVNGKNISEVTIEEAKEIKAQLDARGFKISSLGSPVGKIYLKDDFEAHKKMFAQLLEVAKILESKYMRIFSFFMESGVNHDDYAQEVVAKITELAEMAKPYDIVLLHENEKDIYGDTSERCLNLVKSVDQANFKLVYDPANFVQCKENTLDAYNLLKDHVLYYHIKDAQAADDTVVPAGDGDGQIAEIVEAITDAGYQGFLSLEPHLGNFAGFAALENLENDDVAELEKSDASKFGLAVTALKTILDDKTIAYA
ncbi:sugar phosphate isomerase/epimerase family protein [Vibrio sp. WXL103]|uniref:sugar phosphate isomerase/epimerase family protein n=1 Tax=Vibrio sp. WXL103 TaxID=3450710 RepID=UPI003EC4C9CF